MLLPFHWIAVLRRSQLGASATVLRIRHELIIIYIYIRPLRSKRDPKTIPFEVGGGKTIPFSLSKETMKKMMEQFNI